MKVLFLGPYRDGTGWGHAAVEYIMALDSVGVDVVCLPIKFNSANPELPPRLLELEAKDKSGVDIVIQNVLPPYMIYDGDFKHNIGLFFHETSDFKRSGWHVNLNMMDKVWVSSFATERACRKSKVKNIDYVPVPTNISKFARSYGKNEVVENLKKEGKYVFYTVMELNRRKNLGALIKAFHTEFALWEPVSLVLKINKFGVPKHALYSNIESFCEDVRRGLRTLGKQKRNGRDIKKTEVIIVEDYSEEQMLELHNSADCFVLPSYGEGWCLPAVDALGMGKTPITCGVEFINAENGWPVEYVEDDIFGMSDGLPELYYSNEQWQSISVVGLRRCMREAYENAQLKNQKSEKGFEYVQEFSYQKVGNLMKEKLLSYG